MTLTDVRDVPAPSTDLPASPTAPAEDGPKAERPYAVSPVRASVAALLSSSAAAWPLGAVFTGFTPRAITVVAAVFGTAAVASSYRMRRPAALQWSVLPAAAVIGALLVLPESGSAGLPRLVADALSSGGLAQAPVPFDPGWRFLLFVFLAALGAGATAVAVDLARPQLAVFIPAPLVLGGLLLQPSGGSFVNSVVAIVLLVSSLAVAFGDELQADGAGSGAFEIRRLAKGAGLVAALVVALFGLNSLGLFDAPSRDQVIPPQRPPKPPAAVDRELFTVEAPDALSPWRLGVLDVYQDGAWMTPPFDAGTLSTVPDDGAIAVASEHRSVTTAARTMTFVVKDVKGRDVPTVANPRSAVHQGYDLQYNPRTQTLRLPTARAADGLRYTVQAPPDPRAADLVKAGSPPPALQEFLAVPPPPPAVQELLVSAPKAPLYNRMQYVRDALYRKAVAAGAGSPVDVPPARVEKILSGSPASPYEITAADALLTRWAGVPSRVGYGFFGGELEKGTHRYSVHPSNGAAWVEAYFQGQGWVPIIGVPQKAQESLTNSQQKKNPSVHPSSRIALPIFVPVRIDSIQLLFVQVRYYLARALPLLVLTGLALWLYPALLKVLRRRRRRAWARLHGGAGRMAVAYAEFRDTATDLNIGRPAQSPLDFLGAMAPDAEHAELAWLVTRALWGDLLRDLQDNDVIAAEQLATSLGRRVRRGQTPLNRLLAASARSSLRDPFSDELPNAWLALRPRTRLRSVVRAVGSLRRRRPWRLVPLRGSAVLLVVAVLLVSGCAGGGKGASHAAQQRVTSLPPVPAKIGDVTFSREKAAEAVFASRGDAALVDRPAVYSIRKGGVVQGSLQAAVIKDKYADQQADVRQGVLNSIGTGKRETQRIGRDVLFTVHQPKLVILLWFPPDSSYYQLIVARESFDATSAFAAVLAFQRGQRATGVTTVQQPLDPRRGIED